MRVFDDEYHASKVYKDGTHRTRTPRETLDLIVPRMHEFGITRLADVTGLDFIGVPVYMAVRPNSRALSVSQGKGLDRDAAQASALMESMEGWHAERIQAPLRHESYAALRQSAAVVDVAQLPKLASVDIHAPCLWIEGYDLLTRKPIWVPYAVVMMNFVDPWVAAGPFIASSTGLASGNHLLEAIVHALCEVLERHANSIWLAAGGPSLKERQLDLSTVNFVKFATVLDALHRAEVEIAVWDMTSNHGIPAFTCRIFERYDRVRWSLKGVFGGQGCHLDPEVALMRAATEAIQSRLTSIAGSRDDVVSYETHANPDDLRVMLRMIADPPYAFRDLNLATETFEDDIAVLLGALRRTGVQHVVVVDLTRPDVDIPVVKVVVPGLEDTSSSPRHVPGARTNLSMHATRPVAA